MPKQYTFPTLFDEVKQVSITKLKEFGYMEPDSFRSGRFFWNRNGQEVASINLTVNLINAPYTEFSYTYNKDEEINYKVELTSINSNLGKGKIWYFVCPQTGKRCRKLYNAGKYFLHREAYPNAMYETQTYSKYGRMLDKVCKVLHGSDKLYEELYSKHFKTHYSGKPTKRYKKILSKLEYIEKNHDQALNTFKHELYK